MNDKLLRYHLRIRMQRLGDSIGDVIQDNRYPVQNSKLARHETISCPSIKQIQGKI
jgi:hypothetical protein